MRCVGLGLVVCLAGCGGAEKEQAKLGPDPDAAAAAARAMCQLFKGAGTPCTATGTTAKAGDHELGFGVRVTDEQTALGITSVVMEVDVTVDGTARPELWGHATAAGGDARSNLLQHAFHEWALVYGIAIADSLLDDPGRPALAAVDRKLGAVRVRDRDLFRGWSQLAGGSKKSLDHDALLARLEPVTDALDDEWHGLSMQLYREPGSAQWRCRLDGKEHPALCELAKTHAWPLDSGAAKFKQFYLLSPPRPQAAAPSEDPAAAAEGSPPPPGP